MPKDKFTLNIWKDSRTPGGHAAPKVKANEIKISLVEKKHKQVNITLGAHLARRAGLKAGDTVQAVYHQNPNWGLVTISKEPEGYKLAESGTIGNLSLRHKHKPILENFTTGKIEPDNIQVKSELIIIGIMWADEFYDYEGRDHDQLQKENPPTTDRPPAAEQPEILKQAGG